ncbi:hypothetical protein SAMN02745135_02334 [Caloranaerobacter azorensis DSM 13643]|uniref:Uncharacterized protein n=1 Tax=Caloranaerobacter azorensis DSM 13643 TaxID=1121264 RepID=A0A1M5W7F5_9FIRM|nr:hypothetical protein [Caloranaerobacter azorensis]SHH83519.1 hypothetical protein SAMN02745135_02334 [Caloranaerobacter azorensis DSM 13643]
MKNYYDKNKPKASNGQDIILSTYNAKKFPIIEKETNAFVFPWNMQRDVDAIDTMKFYSGTNPITEEIESKETKNNKLR